MAEALTVLLLVLAVYALIFLWVTFASRNPPGQHTEPLNGEVNDPEADQ